MNLKRMIRGVRSIGRIREVVRCRQDQVDWFILLRGFLRLGGPVFPHRVLTRDGWVVDATDWSDLRSIWVVFWGGEYLLHGDEQVIIDAGANIGAFTVFACRRCPAARIWAVEAFPETVSRLRETIELNRIEQRVKVVQAALVGRAGTVYFDAAPGTLRDSRKVVEGAGEQALRVEGMTLDRLLSRVDCCEIDYLKMDIEGAEYQVFENASYESLRRVRRIGMEYHGTGSYEKLLNRLKTAGFEVTRHLRKGHAGILEVQRSD